MSDKSVMHPLRILQVVPSLAMETGGPTTSVPMIGRTLASFGHKVTLYTTTWPAYGSDIKSFATHHQNGDVRIETFPAVYNPLFGNLPHSPALINSVARHCREFDIVQNFSLWNPVASFTLRALRKSGVPYCVSPLGMLDPVVMKHNRWRKMVWRLLWERANVENAALVHFTTSLEEKRARELWKLSRTVVIPHRVALENWDSLPDASVMDALYPQLRGREIVLFVGRINWVKNLHLLVSSLAKVRLERTGAMLVLVGPDNEGYRAVLEKQARSLGLEDHILFTGMLQGNTLKAAYSRANAFALVSQKENFGHTAAEALACGIPVVVSNEVGVSADWPASNAVFRIEAKVDTIASALVRALQRSAANGIPDPDARSLARNLFKDSEAIRIYTALNSIVLENCSGVACA